MANRDAGGHIGIVGSFDANPLYDPFDKAKKCPYYAFVTLDRKSLDEGYLAGKKEPDHDAAGWDKQLGWNQEVKDHPGVHFEANEALGIRAAGRFESGSEVSPHGGDE